MDFTLNPQLFVVVRQSDRSSATGNKGIEIRPGAVGNTVNPVTKEFNPLTASMLVEDARAGLSDDDYQHLANYITPSADGRHIIYSLPPKQQGYEVPPWYQDAVAASRATTRDGRSKWQITSAEKTAGRVGTDEDGRPVSERSPGTVTFDLKGTPADKRP